MNKHVPLQNDEIPTIVQNLICPEEDIEICLHKLSLQ